MTKRSARDHSTKLKVFNQAQKQNNLTLNSHREFFYKDSDDINTLSPIARKDLGSEGRLTPLKYSTGGPAVFKLS